MKTVIRRPDRTPGLEMVWPYGPYAAVRRPGVSVLDGLGGANRLEGSFAMDFIFEFANFGAIEKNLEHFEVRSDQN